jgi:hypothetical protein
VVSSDAGKWAEKQVAAYLKERSDGSVLFAYHRYPDSRAARGAIASQPADFEVSYRPIGAFNLEVKQTANPRRISKAKVSQYGALLKFWLAGKSAFVLVHIEPLHLWYVLTPDDLFPTGNTLVSSFAFDKPGQTFADEKAAINWILQHATEFQAITR